MVGLIVHEWAERSGGAEQVVDQLIAEFPDAELQLLWNDAPLRYPNARESWLARTPLRRSKALALPIMPLVWRQLPRRNKHDWTLISSHLFAHHARFRGPEQPPKFVYCHTPARYIWEPGLDARGNTAIARIASSILKPLDQRRAQEAKAITANSEFTRQRIERTWGRESSVIYPPVDTESIRSVVDWRAELTPEELAQFDLLPELFLLGASRFVPYKRIDLAIHAGSATGIPVVVAGRGPDEARLRSVAKNAKVQVYFVINPSTSLLRALYQKAYAYVFPAIEDFGIMPIEAMAAGTPIVVPTKGGAAESVALTKGGATFEEDTPEAWQAAIDAVSKIDRRLLPEAASRFSNIRFRREISAWIGDY